MELIPGVFGAMMGLKPYYESKMEGMTPDWLFLDQEDEPHFFGEVVNFHNSGEAEKKMEDGYRAQGWWVGDLPCSVERLSPSLIGKASKYKDLADKLELPFIVF